MARFRGADEIIIGKAKRASQVAKMLAHLIREGLRFHPRIARGLFNLLAMLIRAGQEKHLMPLQAPPARQHIRRHRGIGMADMRLVIHIINRRCDVARFCHVSCLDVARSSGKPGKPGQHRLFAVHIQSFGLIHEAPEPIP